MVPENRFGKSFVGIDDSYSGACAGASVPQPVPLDCIAVHRVEEALRRAALIIVTHNLPDIGDHVRLLKEDGSTVLEGRIKSRLFNYANSYCHAISSSRIRMSASMFWPPNKRKIDRWLPHRISEHGVKA